MHEEPIAIYYGRLMKNGRIVIPEATRTFLGIKEGDYVDLTIQPAKEVVSARFIGRLGRRGLVAIPKHIREKLLLSPGNWLKITLLHVYPASITNHR